LAEVYNQIAWFSGIKHRKTHWKLANLELALSSVDDEKKRKERLNGVYGLAPKKGTGRENTKRPFFGVATSLGIVQG